jgi:hypothetical protein
MLKIKYSGMFRFVDREIITDVSKYRNASIFTVRFVFTLLRVFDPECKGPTILKMPVTNHLYTKCNIVEDLKLRNTFVINTRVVCHPIANKS